MKDDTDTNTALERAINVLGAAGLDPDENLDTFLDRYDHDIEYLTSSDEETREALRGLGVQVD